jgi:hypothetical protein
MFFIINEDTIILWILLQRTKAGVDIIFPLSKKINFSTMCSFSVFCDIFHLCSINKPRSRARGRTLLWPKTWNGERIYAWQETSFKHFLWNLLSIWPFLLDKTLLFFIYHIDQICWFRHHVSPVLCLDIAYFLSISLYLGCFK